MGMHLGKSALRRAAFCLASALAIIAFPTSALATEETASPDVTTAPGDDEGLVLTLPTRPGEAPSVTEGIPHIQLDQTSDPEMMDTLGEWVFSLPSVVEEPSAASLPGARALNLVPELAANPDAMITGREFAHIHADPGTGSMHLRLPEDEAVIVIDAGWGVWHPFAVNGSLPGLIMVWAPRDAADLEVIKLIVEASVRHAGS